MEHSEKNYASRMTHFSFDYNSIPLAKKLKDCGVFGVSSGEYLDYAMKNRQALEMRGQEVLAEMLQKLAHPKHNE